MFSGVTLYKKDHGKNSTRTIALTRLQHAVAYIGMTDRWNESMCLCVHTHTHQPLGPFVSPLDVLHACAPCPVPVTFNCDDCGSSSDLSLPIATCAMCVRVCGGRFCRMAGLPWGEGEAGDNARFTIKGRASRAPSASRENARALLIETGQRAASRALSHPHPHPHPRSHCHQGCCSNEVLLRRSMHKAKLKASAWTLAHAGNLPGNLDACALHAARLRVAGWRGMDPLDEELYGVAVGLFNKRVKSHGCSSSTPAAAATTCVNEPFPELHCICVARCNRVFECLRRAFAFVSLRAECNRRCLPNSIANALSFDIADFAHPTTLLSLMAYSCLLRRGRATTQWAPPGPRPADPGRSWQEWTRTPMEGAHGKHVCAPAPHHARHARSLSAATEAVGGPVHCTVQQQPSASRYL